MTDRFQLEGEALRRSADLAAAAERARVARRAMPSRAAWARFAAWLGRIPFRASPSAPYCDVVLGCRAPARPACCPA